MLITSIHCLYTGNTCTYNVNTCQIQDMYMFIIYIQAANIIYTSYTGHLSDWAWHTLETHVHTLYVHGMYMFYDSHTVCKHHINNASCSKSSILYIDCLDHTQTTLIPVGTGYTQLSRIWSGSVQVVRILWLFSFSGKYMYIQCIDTYIDVFTQKTEKP